MHEEMLQDLDTHINNAVRDVFGTMLNYDLEPVAVTANTWTMNGEPHVAGCVGFTGELNGVVYIYASEVFARRMASRLLGMDQKGVETDEMICDTMGEIANMVAGPIKSRLTDNGMSCVLTIPAIIRGSNFIVETVSSAERRFFAYRCSEGELVTEVVIRNQDTR